MTSKVIFIDDESTNMTGGDKNKDKEEPVPEKEIIITVPPKDVLSEPIPLEKIRSLSSDSSDSLPSSVAHSVTERDKADIPVSESSSDDENEDKENMSNENNQREKDDDKWSITTDELMGMSPYYMILEKFFKEDSKTTALLLKELVEEVSSLRKELQSWRLERVDSDKGRGFVSPK